MRHLTHILPTKQKLNCISHSTLKFYFFQSIDLDILSIKHIITSQRAKFQQYIIIVEEEIFTKMLLNGVEIPWQMDEI